MKTIKRDHTATPLALLDAARQELIQDTLRGSAGRAAAERYADRVDTLLQRLFFADASPPDTPVASSRSAATAAGTSVSIRMSTCWSCSTARSAPTDEQFLRGFLHPLWDLQLVVGHQVRELADFARLETDNPEFLLALLDARPVVGDRALLDRFIGAFHRPETHASSSSRSSS